MGVLYWVLLAGIPLFFVFVYSRSLFAADQSTPSRLRRTGMIHAALAFLAIFLFAAYARRIHNVDLPDSVGWMILAFVLVVLTTFFVSALSLTFRRRSSLGAFSSFLFWPYWLLIAPLFAGRHIDEDSLAASLCSMCFLAAVFFAFAAGALAYYPKTAHAAALAGIAALPWIYTSVLRGNIYWNEWIVFNVPDRELRMYNNLVPTITSIIAVALLVLGVATAALRLVPDRAAARGLLLSRRTWPAFLASFLFLGVWFSQSVMPYRIPGALDYSSWPILQILHVQKRGLQYHETCVKVWGHRGTPESVSVTWNDRRLFEYRFQQRSANVELPKSLGERLASLIQSSKAMKSNGEPIKPLRRWNDEGWYVTGEEVESQAYTTYAKGNQSLPPQEVVDLFDDIEKLPRMRKTAEDRKDVCLGFCYDPVSALGALYANHRCRDEESSRGYVCR